MECDEESERGQDIEGGAKVRRFRWQETERTAAGDC